MLMIYVQVPLDYKFPNGTQASVPLMKVPAQKNSTAAPYKGLLLSNPGGPGGSGIDEILFDGIKLQEISGTNYGKSRLSSSFEHSIHEGLFDYMRTSLNNQSYS